MQLIPSKFFVTSGKSSSPVSSLNAFDRALIEAGIGEQNLVAVSSVLPIGATRIEQCKMPMGAVTHCVLSQMRGREDEIISAGIAYVFRKDGRGGYVAEGHLHGSGSDLEKELMKKMMDMSKIRDVEFGDIEYRIEEMRVPHGCHGCCISAVVFTEYL